MLESNYWSLYIKKITITALPTPNNYNPRFNLFMDRRLFTEAIRFAVRN